MKQKLLWMMAAILTCGSAFTSCGVEDSPVILPNQTSMFIKNIQADTRYTPDILEVGTAGAKVNYLRLDVADIEEAKAEFLKLLPKGVAATAFESKNKSEMFTERIGYVFNNPQNTHNDSIAFQPVIPLLPQLGLVWVELSDYMQKALNADFIIYMSKTENDDMTNFVKCIMAVVPYSIQDPDDPSHLVCSITMEQKKLASDFMTMKMMSHTVINEKGDLEVTLTDKDDKSYGKMIAINDDNITDGALSRFIFDEDLQASMTAVMGGAFSKISFFLAEQ